MKFEYFITPIFTSIIYIGSLIWFMSKQNTQMAFIGQKISELKEQIQNIAQAYVTREILEEKLKRVHQRIDEVSKDTDELAANCRLNHKGRN